MNDYQTTLLSLAQFIVDNAPAGAERDVDVVRYDLEQGKPRPYISLEFRRENASAHLYVEMDGLSYDAVEDEEGNHWHEYKVEARVSWPSWGSDSAKVCQPRLALMTEIVRLAAEIERKFPNVVRKLVSTKAQRAERATRAYVERHIRANMKGMRVGQERRVEVWADEPDLQPVGQIEVVSTAPDGSERRYTTHVTATRTFYFGRVA